MNKRFIPSAILIFTPLASLLAEVDSEQKLKTRIYNNDDKNLKESIQHKSKTIIWEKINQDQIIERKNNIKWELIDNIEKKENYKIRKTFKETININNDLSGRDIAYKKQINFTMLTLGNSVPTALTINEGSARFSFQQISAIERGYAEGTGNQNYNINIDYGLKNNLNLSGFYTHSDDPLNNRITNKDIQPGNRWISYGASIKWKYKSTENMNMAIVSSVEKWDVKSGGCNLYNCKSESNNIFNSSLNPVFNSNTVGMLATPFTWYLSKKVEATFTPRVTILPKSQGNSSGEGEFFKTNYGLGFGIKFQPINNINTFSSFYVPFGDGNNSFDKDLIYSKKTIFTSGFNYSLDPSITFEGSITNGFGSSPSTSILTIPSGNDLLYSGKLIYTPRKFKIPRAIYKNIETNIAMPGLSVAVPGTIEEGNRRFRLSNSAKGSWFSRIDFGASDLFNFDFSLSKVNQNADPFNSLGINYNNPGKMNFRAGGTATFLDQRKGDLFSGGLRLSAGRVKGTGWIFSEIISSYRINNNLVFNLNPKFAWSAIGNPQSIGGSIHWKINNLITVIPETNIAVNEGINNYTLAIRLSKKKGKYIDLYSTNSLSFMDTGQFFKSDSQIFGVNLGTVF